MEFGIALGSNMGDRLRHLQDAVAALRANLVPGAAIEKSPVFSTAPVNCPADTEPFYNAVIVVRFDRSPEELLVITQSIEKAAGRPDVHAREVNASRAIDLDLLYAGDVKLDTEALVLPHPRLHLRRFVLEPLAYLRPGRILPGFNRPVKVLLGALHSDEPPVKWLAADW